MKVNVCAERLVTLQRMAFFALAALTVLAFVSALLSPITALIQLFTTAPTEEEIRGIRMTIFSAPLTVAVLVASFLHHDPMYLLSIIETAYGSIRWRYAGMLCHFPQYQEYRVAACPEILTRLCAAAAAATT